MPNTATIWGVDQNVPPSTLIAHAVKNGGASGNTTAAIDTTGATLLIVAVSRLNTGVPSLTDSKGNTWTLVTEYSSGAGNGRLRFYHCTNPTVGSGHTFTSTVDFGAIAVAAFSGTLNAAPDAENGAGQASATTQQPGSITPSVDDCLIVTAFEYVDAALGLATVNSGFITTDVLADATNFGIGMAYKKQTTAAAVNPMWTSSSAADRVTAAIIAFKPL